MKLRRTIILVACFGSSLSGHSQDTTRISLLFLGDIMQHDSQIKDALNAESGTYNYVPCFQFVNKYFRYADLTIGNLELTFGGKPFKGYPQFSAPDELAVALKASGVDILVTANNHSMDRGRTGVERTISILDSLGIGHTGTFRDTVERMNDYPYLIHKNGFSMALLNYTYGTNGIPVKKPNIVNLIDTLTIKKDLQSAKDLNPDIIIVFMHWGNEYQSQPSKFQNSLASLCFNNGAQLVVGAHPHVLQPMEWSTDRNQLVAYSLGNFVSGQRDRYKNGGAMLSVQLQKVHLTDSTSSTRIDSANYILEWVYRTADANRDYYILPVPEFEKDTSDFIRDAASKLAFKTFTEDSRKLLNKSGLVHEDNRITADSVIFFSITWSVSAADSIRMNHFPFGLEHKTDNSGNSIYRTGNFRRREEAEKYLQRVLLSYPEARIVRVIDKKVLE